MSVRILEGDCLASLRTLPDCAAQTCVTSPPYYGLRDYGHAGQIGLEESPDAYVARLVEVFREVRRVLRDDGALWLNLGDSYAGTGKSGGGAQGKTWQKCGADHNGPRGGKWKPAPAGLKAKDLIGIPWMVAFALRADGWFLRSDIIWHKPNPMPESVRDRPTSAHEHVFLLSKAAGYFYDAAAIAEGAEESSVARLSQDVASQIGSARANGGAKVNGPMRAVGGLTRNARNVWSIATQPYSGAHFATMPPDLAKRCIKAGTSLAGQCLHCGSPWIRLVSVGEPDLDHRRRCGADRAGEYHGKSTKGHADVGVQDASAVKARILAGMRKKVTSGWQQTCECPAHKPSRQLVLDPFGGAGTTGLVADRLGRGAILCELNPEYARLARQRIMADSPLLAGVA